jgi:hypothetical protein
MIKFALKSLLVAYTISYLIWSFVVYSFYEPLFYLINIDLATNESRGCFFLGWFFITFGCCFNAFIQPLFDAYE